MSTLWQCVALDVGRRSDGHGSDEENEGSCELHAYLA